MDKQNFPNITVIFQEAKQDTKPSCLEWIIYIVGIALILFWIGGYGR